MRLLPLILAFLTVGTFAEEVYIVISSYCPMPHGSHDLNTQEEPDAPGPISVEVSFDEVSEEDALSAAAAAEEAQRTQAAESESNSEDEATQRAHEATEAAEEADQATLAREAAELAEAEAAEAQKRAKREQVRMPPTPTDVLLMKTLESPPKP